MSHSASSHQITPLRWLRDLRFKRRYLAYGYYAALKNYLNFMSPWRQTLDYWAVGLQSLKRAKPCRIEMINRVWETIGRNHDYIDGAFFLDVHWYKSSLFVGPIVLEGQSAFLKAFRDTAEVSAQAQQTRFARTHFGDYFIMSDLLFSGENYLALDLIEHDQTPPGFTDLYEAGLDMARDLYTQHRYKSRPLDAILPLDLPLLFEKEGAVDLWRSVFNTIGGGVGRHLTPVIDIRPAHGDFTPWNTFRTPRGEIALIDYERCGWYVPFYDMFHLICQPAAMAGEAVFPDQFLDEISMDETDISPHKAHRWFMLYLLDQLHFDLSGYHTDGRPHKRLRRTIDLKKRLLRVTLKRMEAAGDQRKNAA